MKGYWKNIRSLRYIVCLGGVLLFVGQAFSAKAKEAMEPVMEHNVVREADTAYLVKQGVVNKTDSSWKMTQNWIGNVGTENVEEEQTDGDAVIQTTDENSQTTEADSQTKNKKKNKKKSSKKQYGWVKQSGKYYYYDRITGKQKKNCKVDGIKLKKDGSAKKTEYNISKIKIMMKARKVVNRITKQSDSKEQKLKKVFDYVKNVKYNRHHRLPEEEEKKGWELVFANDIFKYGDGCCISQSCALAFLVHECGYKTVYICHDGDHAWVEINGGVYDALFARIKNYDKYYNGDYKTVHLSAVVRKKV